MRTHRVPAAITVLIAAILVGAGLVSKNLAPPDSPAGPESASYEPIPAEDVARLDKDGTHFTPDEAATAASSDESAKAVTVAVGALNFLSEEQVAYVSLGEATLDEVPALRERTRVWVVLLRDVEVPKLGGQEGEEKPSVEEFYVVVDATTMTASYGGTFDENI